ncbi:hypothetical protein F7725_007123 [Dissostichus mawsoni]|uniref:Uncharacterized protein n=1 Tax=Dissostichus mawsoni TaxID=36200 RepID=A0A7J5XWI3_DISMA|nr:hypothetical protein F7725_007123 [Dissostichus mawsoni]
MCVESDGCEIEGCSTLDEVRTLSGSMSPALKSNPDLHPCKPGHKFRAALLKCRSPAAAAGILTFGNVLNYMDRYTVVEGLNERGEGPVLQWQAVGGKWTQCAGLSPSDAGPPPQTSPTRWVRPDLQCSFRSMCSFLRLSVKQTRQKWGASGTFQVVLKRSVNPF